MINYLFLNGTSWVLCITRGNFSFSSKDTKSIFEILIFFSFFLNITSKRWSKILNHSMFIIARKLPNQINFRDCFDHPSTNFPKKKKKFPLYIILYVHTNFPSNFRIFKIKQISLETLFKYFSEPPCTYVKQKRRKERREKSRRKKIGGKNGTKVDSLVERQLDRGKGEPLVTGFRCYTVM